MQEINEPGDRLTLCFGVLQFCQWAAAEALQLEHTQSEGTKEARVAADTAADERCSHWPAWSY